MTSVEKYLSYEPKDELDLQTLRKACEGILKIRDFVPIHPKAILHLIDQSEAAQNDAARYQWLRDNCTRAGVIVDVGAGAEIFNTIDDAIDDAMASKS